MHGGLLFWANQSLNLQSISQTATALLIAGDCQQELSLQGQIVPVTTLEADAVFLTMCRAQQIKACAAFLHESLQKITKRYKGKMISRPDDFVVYRLVVDFWRLIDSSEPSRKKIESANRSSCGTHWIKQQSEKDVLVMQA